MIEFVLQSLASILLAGGLVFATLTKTKNNLRLQHVLFGVLFGVVVVTLGMSGIHVGSFSAPFDLRAGPLLFAGYLGGPIGGLIAGVIGISYPLKFDVPEPMIGVFMTLAIPAIGVAVRYMRPLESWPNIRTRAVVYAVLGFALLHIPPYLFLASTASVPNSYVALVPVTLAFIAVGTLSILLTWQIIGFAVRSADHTNRAIETAFRLRLAMRACGVGMFVLTRGDSGPYYDAEMIKLLGLDREPGIVPFSELAPLFHPEDLAHLREEFGQAWAGERQQGKTDCRITRKDGTLRYFRAAWHTELDSKGNVSRITGMNSDLTDFYEAEGRANSSKERLASIAQTLPGVMVDWDITDWAAPKLTYVSPKCLDIWGYTNEELLADQVLLAQMHDPKDLGRFLRAMKAAQAAGTPIYYRYMITARDGNTRWLDLFGDFATEGRRTLIRAILLDVTKEVHLQLKVEKEREISIRAQQNESLGQLTGGVAHDFNNLLAVILGNLELLREDDDPEAQKEYIDAAITATLRGADLTKNMLAFARQAPLAPVVLDLNTVVREAKNWMARAIPASIEIETSLLAGLWPIEADRTSLESALLNLALNARDAMNGHGKLTIETSNVRIDESYIDIKQEELVPGRYVLLAVTDNGTGIADDVIENIFDPFFSTKQPGVGSGLGLSMTLGFMRQSGGTVQVYSEPGYGTTFKLYFPVSKTALQPPTQPKLDSDMTRGIGKKLLVAEDEEEVRATVVKILERAGYHVTATKSGDAAYAVFEADPTFDLVVTDIVMPGKLQGTGLAKALRERWPELPVLFMSGYASEATVHGNGLRPEDIRLMKPVQRAELLAAILQAMSNIKT